MSDQENACNYITWFYERNFLGLLANTWVQLCQNKGKHGPKDLECLKLANCHQIMVDVGKQGKCVNFERLKFFREILKKLENSPD